MYSSIVSIFNKYYLPNVVKKCPKTACDLYNLQIPRSNWDIGGITKWFSIGGIFKTGGETKLLIKTTVRQG